MKSTWFLLNGLQSTNQQTWSFMLRCMIFLGFFFAYQHLVLLWALIYSKQKTELCVLMKGNGTQWFSSVNKEKYVPTQNVSKIFIYSVSLHFLLCESFPPSVPSGRLAKKKALASVFNLFCDWRLILLKSCSNSDLVANHLKQRIFCASWRRE